MRMRDERNAARRGAVFARFVGQVQRDLDLADRAVDQIFLRVYVDGGAY